VEMVGRYALQDPDPASETWEEKSAGGQPFYLGDIYTAGINCTRGAAAESIAAILFSEHDRLGILRPVLERLVEDAQISVRACAAKCLVALLNRDRDLALRLFFRLVDTRDELLGTPYVERFLYYTVLPDFGRVAPVIERMIKSQIDNVAKAGARQGCLASLELDDARDLRDRCMSGRTALRSGAATIFASNLRSAGHRAICEQSLRDLFNDPDADVGKRAAGCFDHLKGSELAEFVPLAIAFMGSSAFVQDHHSLLRALKACEVSIPDVTCRFAERFVEIAGLASGDISTAFAGDAPDVSELVVRVYSQAGDHTQRDRALGVIDRMSALRAYGLDNVLQRFERT